MIELIVPDIHQNIPWAEKILQREAATADHITFIGDYFDSFDPPASAKRTSEWLVEKKKQFGDRATWLVGNHDLMYFSVARNPRRPPQTLARSHPYYCSGYTRSRADDIARYLPEEFMHDCQIMRFTGKYIISHAGFCRQMWPIMLSDDEALVKLQAGAVRAYSEFRFNTGSTFFWVGRARDGVHPFSGPLWLDFIDEFEDDLPFPQIVGHTSRPKTDNQRGRSFCIDNMQSTYGVLTDGNLEIRTLDDALYRGA